MNPFRAFADYCQLNWHLYHLSPSRLRRWHEHAVIHLVERVRAASPFYRDLYDGRQVASLEDFRLLPTINKASMMAHFDTLNTEGLKLADVMAFALQKEQEKDYLGYYQDRFVVGLSSGTSGNKGIYVTPRELTERLPGVFLARGGVRLSDLPLRILFILRVFSQGFADINAPMIQLHYLSSMTDPREIVTTCNQLRTNVLMAPPSLLRQLLPLSKQIMIPLRRIITHAEVLEPLEKERLEQAFHAPVVEIYQASEGQIASPCRCGSLHINEDLVYVELLDEQGRPIPEKAGFRSSRMLVTNLVNTVQPLLRYEMNDLVELGGSCPCGSSFRVLSRIIGRNDDVLYLRDRSGRLRPVYPDLVSRWIITTNDRIREFLVEQDSPDHLAVTLDLARASDQTDQTPAGVQDDGLSLANRLKARFEQELAAFDIVCSISIQLKQIPMPADNRKRKRFVSSMTLNNHESVIK